MACLFIKVAPLSLTPVIKYCPYIVGDGNLPSVKEPVLMVSTIKCSLQIFDKAAVSNSSVDVLPIFFKYNLNASLVGAKQV